MSIVSFIHVCKMFVCVNDLQVTGAVRGARVYIHECCMHAVRLLLDRACALILIKSLNEGVLPRGFTTEYS